MRQTKFIARTLYETFGKIWSNVSYIIRNIAPDFPVCMFIPIIASRHVALPYVAYPPKATAIWIKAVAAGTCRPARGAILLAGRTDGRTYEISLPSCIYPDRVQHPSLFSLAAKTKGWSGQNSKQKTKFIATRIHVLFSRGLPLRKSGLI